MRVSTFAIIVTFYPNLEQLTILCKCIGKYAEVIVVDNTPFNDAPAHMHFTHWVSMGDNYGIGAAQNAGIRAARQLGAQAVAFFDQDSCPKDELLPNLVAFLGNPPKGVAAPICVDMRSGREYPSFQFNLLGWAKPIYCLTQNQPIKVDLIISSGSVVALEVFDKVGMMNEDLFIDYVDLEWCIRCRNAGVSITVYPSVTMPHSIGDRVFDTNLFSTFIHSPVRSYYRVRNAFLLLRMRHVPRLYAWHEILAAGFHHLIQWRYSSNPTLHSRMGWKAILDGMRGIQGKLDKHELTRLTKGVLL
jgi:rhamnosyltransferase